MKCKLTLLKSVLLLMSLAVITACKDDSGETDDGPREVVQDAYDNMVGGTWVPENDSTGVIQKNKVPHDDWSDFEMTFYEDTTYTITGGNEALQDAERADFSWNVGSGGSVLNGIDLASGRTLTFPEQPSSSGLSFTFSYDSASNARTVSYGEYEFNLSKQ